MKGDLQLMACKGKCKGWWRRFGWGDGGESSAVFVVLPWLMMSPSRFAAVSCPGEQPDRGVSRAGAHHHPLRHTLQPGDRIILNCFSLLLYVFGFEEERKVIVPLTPNVFLPPFRPRL